MWFSAVVHKIDMDCSTSCFLPDFTFDNAECFNKGFSAGSSRGYVIKSLHETYSNNQMPNITLQKVQTMTVYNAVFVYNWEICSLH